MIDFAIVQIILCSEMWLEMLDFAIIHFFCIANTTLYLSNGSIGMECTLPIHFNHPLGQQFRSEIVYLSTH